ncbi:MAG: ATP-dependent zinc protease family protein [Gammaproteobacteria bacterium]
MKRNFRIVFLLLLASLAPVNQGLAEKNSKKITVGWVEDIILAEGRVRVRAKLDTGAKTSSIHSENIEQFEVDGKPWVRFRLPKSFLKKAKKAAIVEAPIVRTVLIKRHNLESVKRLVVELPFCLDDHYYKTQFTLANRTNYIYPVLLGRAFLADNVIVDPSLTHKKSKSTKRKRLECMPE